MKTQLLQGHGLARGVGMMFNLICLPTYLGVLDDALSSLGCIMNTSFSQPFALPYVSTLASRPLHGLHVVWGQIYTFPSNMMVTLFPFKLLLFSRTHLECIHFDSYEIVALITIQTRTKFTNGIEIFKY